MTGGRCLQIIDVKEMYHTVLEMPTPRIWQMERWSDRQESKTKQKKQLPPKKATPPKKPELVIKYQSYIQKHGGAQAVYTTHNGEFYHVCQRTCKHVIWMGR